MLRIFCRLTENAERYVRGQRILRAPTGSRPLDTNPYNGKQAKSGPRLDQRFLVCCLFEGAERMSSLVEELQRDALNWDISVTQLLQKCFLVASKLDVKALVKWTRMELDGYEEEVPEYRRVLGKPQIFNPYHGFQPMIFEDPKAADAFSRMPFSHPISEIEHLLHSCDGGGVRVSYNTEAQNLLRRAFHTDLEPSLRVSSAQLKKIVEAVRGAILDWSLKLEASGVKGDGMSFSAKERESAKEATYHIQNHIYGNVSGSQVGTMRSTQEITQQLPELREFVSTVQQSLENLGLDATSLEELKSEIQTLTAQAASPRPKSPVIRESLKSVRSILEGLTGSLLAAGLLKEVAKFFN